MFDKLFSPLQIGEIEIKNRIQVTPHEQQYLENGLPSETMIHYYIERAMGGAGLLEVSQLFIKASRGAVFPNWNTDSARRFPLVTNPSIVPGLSKLAESVHEYGAKMFMELSAWTHLYGPVSAVPFESGLSLKELSRDNIKQIQEDFANGAKLIVDSKFDGIDLHGTHGALIEHFYSPVMNRRTDEYGGSFDNRMRFLNELIEILRGTLRPSIALGMRICADEKYLGGVTPESCHGNFKSPGWKTGFSERGQWVRFAVRGNEPALVTNAAALRRTWVRNLHVGTHQESSHQNKNWDQQGE